MGDGFRRLKEWIAADRYLVTKHAVERLEERDILEWQVIAIIDDPTETREIVLTTGEVQIHVEGLLSDGSEIRAVWAMDEELQAAVLVTVFLLS